MNTQILEEIGLTKTEIKIYLTLLKLGQSTTTPIIREAKIHASKVYEYLDKLIQKGLVTYVEGGKLKIAEIESLSELSPGEYGILEPKIKKECEIRPNLILVPGVGFDHSRNRIGYGKGYYDKFLKTEKAKDVLKIGLSFDLQVLPALPKEGHDVQMDTVLTETRIL